MKRMALLLVLAMFGVPPAKAGERGAKAEIHGVREAQAAAWNRGDIGGFMQGYWKSPQTTFAGAQGVERGWQAVFDRYRRAYPDRAAMGTLTFSDIEITLLAPDAALILARWRLARHGDRPGGVFTLVVRRFPEGWRIIHDHTSTLSPAKK